MSEEFENMITEHRRTAEAMGQAALEAIGRGDIGLARTAARQAAQWARVVMQLETGEKQSPANQAVGVSDTRA
jgi:hypothetical protein